MHDRSIQGGSTPSCSAHMRLGRLLHVLEVPLLIVVPGVMLACAVAGIVQAGIFSLVVAMLALAFFFAGWEVSRPALRQIMPTLVLAALAAAGRILFAAVPDVKPVSAIAIMAGATLGPRAGFMVGALAALTSNMFFGQGMWTPWQMYAWGLVGYAGGVLGSAGVFERTDGTPRRAVLALTGTLSGLVYGAIINAYDIVAFVQPLTMAGALARLLAALPFDVVHGLSTAVFLVVLWGPWVRRLKRVVRRYGLAQS